MLPRNCHWLWTDVGQDHKNVKGTQVRGMMPSGTTSLAGAPTPLRGANVTDTDTRHYKFDIFAVLRPIHSSTTMPDTRIHHLDTYNNPQQPSIRLRHTCVYQLISSKSVGASSLIVSFHFTLYRHNDKPYWLWRYDAIRYDLILRVGTKIFCSIKVS